MTIDMANLTAGEINEDALKIIFKGHDKFIWYMVDLQWDILMKIAFSLRDMIEFAEIRDVILYKLIYDLDNAILNMPEPRNMTRDQKMYYDKIKIALDNLMLLLLSIDWLLMNNY